MKVPFDTIPPPPTMPRVRSALWLVRDAKGAIERALTAWNREQLEDALDSANNFIALAKAELEQK